MILDENVTTNTNTITNVDKTNYIPIERFDVNYQKTNKNVVEGEGGFAPQRGKTRLNK